MQTRRWGEDVIEDKRLEFEQVMGKTYEDSAFQSPEAMPIAVRPIVATIKVLEATSRQMEISNEVQRFPKIGPAVNLIGNEHLAEEFERLENICEIWGNGKAPSSGR